MARSKPQTNITINYGVVNPTNAADTLSPVFVAPRYAVHGVDYKDGLLVNSLGSAIVYNGEALTAGYAWPDRKESESLVDYTGATLVMSAPVVRVGTSASGNASGLLFTATSGAVVGRKDNVNFYTLSGVASAAAPVAGANTVLAGGYQLRPGDQLIYTSGGTVKDSAYVTQVERGTTAPVAQLAANTIPTSGATVALDASNFTGNETTVYTLTVQSATSGALTAWVANTAGDLGWNPQQVVFSGGVATDIGNYGLKATATIVDASEVTSGSVALIQVTPSGVGELTRAVVNKDLTDWPTAVAEGETVFVKTANLITGTAQVTDTSWEASASGITEIKANAQVVYGKTYFPVLYCDAIYANYRELLQSDVNALYAGSISNILDWVGPLTPENPLGMCYAAGVNSGADNFYLVAVSDDTDEAYATAMQAAGKVERAYALIPIRQTPAVITAAEGIVAKYSDKSVAQFKRLWLYSQVPQNAPALTDENGNAVNVLASIDANGELTLTQTTHCGKHLDS